MPLNEFPNHALVSIGGIWTNADMSAESWSFGVRIVSAASPGGGYLTDCQGFADTIAPLLSTWWSSTSNLFPNTAKMVDVKVNNITPTGHYLDPVTHEHIFSPSVAGGKPTQLPAIMALCWTWETGASRGPAHRGRSYPPVTISAAGFSGGNSVNTTDQTTHLAAGKALLGILGRSAPPDTTTPVVVSKRFGLYELIDGVSVDTRLDSQRRRSRQVAGARSSLAWP